jgi:hypothetical protein
MEEFVITIPRGPSFSVVADLVVGGIAARHDFTLDVLDDLQLALDSLLEHGVEDESDVTIELRVAEHELVAVVGPVPDQTVAELEREAGTSIGLRRLLETTVDDVVLSQRDGAVWVELRKDFALAGAEG